MNNLATQNVSSQFKEIASDKTAAFKSIWIFIQKMVSKYQKHGIATDELMRTKK